MGYSFRRNIFYCKSHHSLILCLEIGTFFVLEGEKMSILSFLRVCVSLRLHNGQYMSPFDYYWMTSVSPPKKKPFSLVILVNLQNMPSLMVNTVFYNQLVKPHSKRPHEMLIQIVCSSWELSTQISQNSVSNKLRLL